MALAQFTIGYSHDGNGGSPITKKPKKSSISKNASSNALDPNDQVALNRRAERFQREHQLERQKQNGTNHLKNNNRVFSASFGDTDEPEVVSCSKHF